MKRNEKKKEENNVGVFERENSCSQLKFLFNVRIKYGHKAKNFRKNV